VENKKSKKKCWKNQFSIAQFARTYFDIDLKRLSSSVGELLVSVNANLFGVDSLDESSKSYRLFVF
jgi:hypothetical protein